MSEHSASTGADRTARLGAAARVLIARAEGADARGAAALKAAIDDVMLAPDARLDDRTRAGLSALIEALVATLADELAERGAKLLTSRGQAALGDALIDGRDGITARLAAAGLLRDVDLLGEVIARVRVEQIGAALPVEGPGEASGASLLARLVQSPDRVVASAASALLAGESHRRAPADGAPLGGTGLPSELHQRLLWWVAAALRERALPEADGDTAALDRAVAESALRNIAAHDDSDRVEAAAMRLAAAIDAQADELPALLDEALRDRRLALFAALLAHALGVKYEMARDMVLDPSGDRLWLVLRALEMPRPAIARVGYLLSEADPRRDVEAFADLLDVIVSVDPEAARLAVEPLRLHPDYRAAMLALGGVR